MGWFENQIEERRNVDQQLLEDSFVRVAGVILGEKTAQRMVDERIITKNSIDEILRFFRFKTVDIPDDIKDKEAQLEYCLRPHGIMYRRVELDEDWYKYAFGPMLVFTKEGEKAVAMLPGNFGGYNYKDPDTGIKTKVNKNNAKLFKRDALCFYRPLPQKELGITDFLTYMKRSISATDVAVLAVVTFLVTLIGMLIPRITKAITGPVLSSGKSEALIGIAICMICVQISMQLFTSIKALLARRIEIKTSVGIQAAVMMRVMSLPASFFRGYSPGELKSRVSSVNQLCSLVITIVFSTGLTTLMSLLYLGQIAKMTPVLAVPAFIILLITLVFTLITTLLQASIQRKQMDAAAVESGMAYSIISGVQKIKLAGAEKRIFAKWLDIYTKIAELSFDPPMFLKIDPVIGTAITLLSNIVIYFMAIKGGVDQSSYYAFTAAYGMVSGAFMMLASTAGEAALIKPTLEMAEPFLKIEPESAEKKEIVTDISGRVDIEHVAFRYDEKSPYIFNDLSIKIRQGEYVAVVGKTGCGKSTLVRLLLGFEKPEKGAIFYDGKDINSLDLQSLRRKIGVVMQAGGLFQGDIYTNIVISAPDLTLDDAWEAAEKAGIADDIRSMPMGMSTFISEGQGGISGGQKQRILIARAIAPKPKLLIFDEATSALDNKTQKQVSEALDAMGCTRIVIAHRLSTIKHCDRIIVFDGGAIVEDGTYDELIAKKGFFADLVERQRVDAGEK